MKISEVEQIQREQYQMNYERVFGNVSEKKQAVLLKKSKKGTKKIQQFERVA